MEYLTKLVTEKSGISAEQAQTAVSAMMGELKAKVPAVVYDELLKVANGEPFDEFPFVTKMKDMLTKSMTDLKDESTDWSAKINDSFASLSDSAKSFLGGMKKDDDKA